jgi:hypothetical protein
MKLAVVVAINAAASAGMTSRKANAPRSTSSANSAPPSGTL